MKFEKAFEEVLKKTPENLVPRGDPNIPKILAFLWSMIALSEKELDDIVYISENNNIVSIPLQKSSSSQKTATKKEEKKVKSEDGEKKKKSKSTKKKPK